MSAFVYFARYEPGKYKIGYTIRPEQRLAGLREISDAKWHRLIEFPDRTTARKAEYHLHRWFAKQSIGREKFRIADEASIDVAIGHVINELGGRDATENSGHCRRHQPVADAPLPSGTRGGPRQDGASGAGRGSSPPHPGKWQAIRAGLRRAAGGHIRRNVLEGPRPGKSPETGGSVDPSDTGGDPA